MCEQEWYFFLDPEEDFLQKVRVSIKDNSGKLYFLKYYSQVDNYNHRFYTLQWVFSSYCQSKFWLFVISVLHSLKRTMFMMILTLPMFTKKNQSPGLCLMHQLEIWQFWMNQTKTYKNFYLKMSALVCHKSCDTIIKHMFWVMTIVNWKSKSILASFQNRKLYYG